MAQGNGNAATEAAQAAQAAAAAAAAAASNPTLIQHMTNFGGRGHHEAELNLSQNSNPGNGENPDHMNPGHLEEEDRARCLRSYAASGGPGAGTYPHPHELHPGYDPMDPADFERTYQQRPVDLGYNRSYSPNPVAAIAASASVTEGWTHPLAVNSSDWIDSRVGQHAGIPWPPHSHDQRYVPTATSMKWETISNSGVGVGGPGSAVSGLSGVGCYKKIKKVGSPGGPGPHDQDGDETLQHLTVKELNKRVQNLPRDEVVALKQRRRTLKNRGYAMNCRLRRQENREKLEHQVKILTDKLNQVSHERDYFRAQWEKLQHLHATAVAANASRSSTLNGGQHAENLHMGGQGQLDLSMSGTAAAAAAQAHHEDYKRDNYQNNNDLKIGSISTDDFRRNAIQNHFLMPTRSSNKNETNNNHSPNFNQHYMPMDLKVETSAENMENN